MTQQKQIFTIVARVPEYLQYSGDAEAAREKASSWVDQTFKTLVTKRYNHDLELSEHDGKADDLACYRVKIENEEQLAELDRRIAASAECAPPQVIIRVFSESDSGAVGGPMTAADALRETNDTRGQFHPETLMRIEK